jgi:hypothetical protein
MKITLQMVIQLTVVELVKKFSEIYRNPMFITVLSRSGTSWFSESQEHALRFLIRFIGHPF